LTRKGKRFKACLLAGMMVAGVNNQKLALANPCNKLDQQYIDENSRKQLMEQYGTEKNGDKGGELPSKEEKDIFLTKAPDIELMDERSGSVGAFLVKSANYVWNWQEENELGTVNVCGRHPLEIIPDQEDILKIQDDCQQEEISYIFHCCVMPETLIVREWDASQLGKADTAEPLEKFYKEPERIWLKHDKIYEIVAKWSKEDGGNKFFGEASYVVMTD